MNSETPLVSIIVPIYNAEIYLAGCLSSIASQTYQNIEVILINDGSTDNSYNVAKLFCEKNSNFKLVNQANTGVAGARERGLRLAQGEFVIHADSDDLMAERAIEYLYKSIVENSSNIAVGSYVKESEVGKQIITHSAIDKDIFIRNVITGKYHSGLWNKLIKMDLCKDIGFDKNINYMEDKLFLAKVLIKENVKISIINKIVYFYRMVDNSYTNNITKESVLSSIKVTNKVCDIFQEKYGSKFTSHVKNKNKVMVLLNSKKTQRNIFPESIKYILNDKNLPFKHKIVILFDFLHMNFFIDFYKFLSIKISKRSV